MVERVDFAGPGGRLDDEVWAAAYAHEAGVDARTVLATLEGFAAHGATLPDGTFDALASPVAIRVLQRVADLDPAAARHAAKLDGRPYVIGCVSDYISAAPTSTETALEALEAGATGLAAQLRDEGMASPGAAFHVGTFLAEAKCTDHLAATVAAQLLGGAGGLLSGDAAERLVTAARFLEAMGRPATVELLAPLVAPFDSDVRALTCAASAITSVEFSVGSQRGWSAADVVAAGALLDAIPQDTVLGAVESGDVTRTPLRVQQVRYTLGRWLFDAGAPLTGPGSVATIWGHSDPAGMPAQIIDQVLVCADAATRTVTDAELAELLTAATCNGTLLRPLPEMPPEMIPRSVSPQVAAAVICADTITQPDLRYIDALVMFLCGRLGHRYASEVLECRPELVDALAPQVAAVLIERAAASEVPRSLAEASMRAGHLGAWVAHCTTTRAEVVKLTAGIGLSRATVFWSMVDQFAGTPAELVELTAELAPAH